MTIICSFNRNGERVIFSDGRMTNTRDCKIAVENSKKIYEHNGILLGLAGSSYLTIRLCTLLDEEPDLLVADDIRNSRHNRLANFSKRVRAFSEPFKIEMAAILAVLPGCLPATLFFEATTDNVGYQYHQFNIKSEFLAIGSGAVSARCLYDTVTSLVPNISNKDLAEEIVASVSKHHIDVGGKLQYVAIKEEEE